MDTLRSCWKSFSVAVIPADASPNQRIQMRRAFYAGAAAVTNFMVNRVPQADEEIGMEMIEEWVKELVEFRIDLKKGNA